MAKLRWDRLYQKKISYDLAGESLKNVMSAEVIERRLKLLKNLSLVALNDKEVEICLSIKDQFFNKGFMTDKQEAFIKRMQSR
jgi:hypothetical protein